MHDTTWFNQETPPSRGFVCGIGSNASQFLALVRLLAVLALLNAQSPLLAAEHPGPKSERELARQILADGRLTNLVSQAKALLQSGFTSGTSYYEVWIRDFNTFIELALQVNDPTVIRQQLLRFFQFQGPEGDIVDGLVETNKSTVPYRFRKSDLEPNLWAHKNTVETDQESSLVIAVGRYVRLTGDKVFLDQPVAGKTVRERLEWALKYVHENRFSQKYGLVWGATTTDWGDVQPEHSWGVEQDENSHPAIDIYDNALYVVALDEFVKLPGVADAAKASWGPLAQAIRKNTMRHLWDKRRSKFHPHIYLERGSPFPADFDEERIHFNGGTTVALEAGLLSQERAGLVLEQMRKHRREIGAGSIALQPYPAYPEGYFQNKVMRPYSYCNGGDWTWWGGRTIQQLIRLGRVEDAYREVLPMIDRALRDGFVEWYDIYNQPQGSRQFRGAAGTLGLAVEQLLTWARDLTGNGN